MKLKIGYDVTSTILFVDFAVGMCSTFCRETQHGASLACKSHTMSLDVELT